MTAGRRDCRITRVETHLVGTRWCNWVFARVFTDDGITGIGEGTCEWQAKAVEAAIDQLAERHVIGQSAFAIERTWQAMFRNEFARGGPILNSAIGALEIAMWDIVGKALGRPVHELLGGRVHERLPAYANAWYGTGATPAEIGAAARAVRDKGYRGLKLDPFESSARDPDHALIRQAVERVAAVREAVGPEMEILIDCHGRFSPASAIAIAQELEACRLYWFEEPCDAENVAALAKVGRSIRTRLATGERCYTKYHLQALLKDCEVGVLQPDIMHVGGILEAKKIAGDRRCQLRPGLLSQPVRAGGDRGRSAAGRLHHQLHHAGIVLRVQRTLALRPAGTITPAGERPLRDPDRARPWLRRVPGRGGGSAPVRPERLPADVERRVAQALLTLTGKTRPSSAASRMATPLPP
jgi:galactonate dehydratase